VFYTEGEVMQGFFALLLGRVGTCLLIGVRSRRTAIGCVTQPEVGQAHWLWMRETDI
jgi:hypothetical protein